jgi:hypothetical protein
MAQTQNDSKSPPLNFDFGKHWNAKIVPLLKNSSLQKAIRDGVNEFISPFPFLGRYRHDMPPSRYGRTDYDRCLMHRKEDVLIETLRKQNKLPASYLKLEKADPDDKEYDGQKLLKAKHEILKPYFAWNNIRNDLESYLLVLGCHYWAPTFELTLARLVEPRERWVVVAGEKHSTVMNKAGTNVLISVLGAGWKTGSLLVW